MRPQKVTALLLVISGAILFFVGVAVTTQNFDIGRVIGVGGFLLFMCGVFWLFLVVGRERASHRSAQHPAGPTHALRCSSCGAVVGADDSVCRKCGKPISFTFSTSDETAAARELGGQRPKTLAQKITGALLIVWFFSWITIGILYPPKGDVGQGLLFGVCGFGGSVILLAWWYRLWNA